MGQRLEFVRDPANGPYCADCGCSARAHTAGPCTGWFCSCQRFVDPGVSAPQAQKTNLIPPDPAQQRRQDQRERALLKDSDYPPERLDPIAIAGLFNAIHRGATGPSFWVYPRGKEPESPFHLSGIRPKDDRFGVVGDTRVVAYVCRMLFIPRTGIVEDAQSDHSDYTVGELLDQFPDTFKG